MLIPRDGLVAEYLFNGNADDTSGNSFHGVVHGATLAPDRFERPNSAYAFDGKDDYIVVSRPPKLMETALTVSVWARCDSRSLEGWHDCIICQDNGADDDHARRIFQLSMLGDRVFWHRMMEAPDPFSIDPIEPGAWYHITAVVEDGLHKLYVNGVLNNSVRHRLAVHDEEPMCIGRKGTSEQYFYFNGAIDDVRIYNRALSEAEIASL
jgi:Concanavalin A-like lectin/glucanases superfamily